MLDPDFGPKLLSLAQKMPVWVISSLANDHAIEAARDAAGAWQITRILRRDGESPSELLARSLCAIDEHHGEVSNVIPYETVWVYGSAPTMLSTDLAGELELGTVIETSEGFRATKQKK